MTPELAPPPPSPSPPSPPSVLLSQGQTALPRPRAHSGGVQEQLRSRAAEIQQGAELLLLHGDAAALQRETELCPNKHTSFSQQMLKPWCFGLFFHLHCGQQKLQDMEERRIRQLAAGYCQFSDVEKKVLPIICKCLDGISAAGTKINEKQVNVHLLGTKRNL